MHRLPAPYRTGESLQTDRWALLTETLRSHAFAGLGQQLQIWERGRFRVHHAEAAQMRAKGNRSSFERAADNALGARE
jgi:hypothetical protein